MLFLIILFLVLFVVFLLLLIPINFFVNYNNEKFEYKFNYLFFKISDFDKFKKTKSKENDKDLKNKNGEKQKAKNKGVIEKISDIINLFSIIIAKLNLAVKHIIISKIWFDIKISDEDSAKAAIKYGKVCAVVYPALAILESRVKKVKKQSGNINCVYNYTENIIYFNLSGNIKPIFLLNLIIKILFEFLKIKKGTVKNNE